MSSTTVRVAYTLEQCWHSAPGGTAIAALRIAREMRNDPELAAQVELLQVAGKHARLPAEVFRPTGEVAMLPIARPVLYEAWMRTNWPKVEAVTGPIDVAHATGLIPCGTAAPQVVTIHDVAFLHDPDKFSRHGVRSMTRALDVARRRAARVVCPSAATMDDLLAAGFTSDRLRLVPLGVDAMPATAREIDDARTSFDLPDRFVLFVGSLEPRKNLRRLVQALGHLDPTERAPLVVAGAGGWGDEKDAVSAVSGDTAVDVRFVGAVSEGQLRGLYSSASVFAYPSEREGFGLPVLEAMAQGTVVVTSRGTSTEEVAGGAAVLVDPFDVDDITRGLSDALSSGEDAGAAGRERARQRSWTSAAQATVDVYRELSS